MAWFSPLTRDVVDLQPEEIQPDAAPASLLDRGRASVSGMLDRFRADERALVADIEDRTERLRQTRVAIEAFEAADKILIAGDPDFAEVEQPSAAPGKSVITMKQKNARS
ncbi:MAG: hypothetical protein M9939_26450 [Mesorhizobium sp.]|nr:hypothetical protein [Mesorhizobium sp.]MCO5085112.1 hypothetical protein [Rhizobiaceae bacterium]MCO5164634.1 hypothetical protein [Mesorhizobium sp.]